MSREEFLAYLTRYYLTLEHEPKETGREPAFDGVPMPRLVLIALYHLRRASKAGAKAGWSFDDKKNLFTISRKALGELCSRDLDEKVASSHPARGFEDGRGFTGTAERFLRSHLPLKPFREGVARSLLPLPRDNEYLEFLGDVDVRSPLRYRGLVFCGYGKKTIAIRVVTDSSIVDRLVAGERFPLKVGDRFTWLTGETLFWPDVAVPSMAFDSAELLSADSYGGFTDYQDPNASAAFEFVVSLYVTANNLYFRHPPQAPLDPTPLLRLFWSVPETESVPLDLDVGMLARWRELRDPFLEHVVRNRTEDLIAWVRLHVNDARLDEVFWCAGQESMFATADVVRLEDVPAGLDFARRVEAVLVPVGRGVEAMRRFGSVAAYALAFGFWGFAKGATYAGSHPEGPVYHAHWLRQHALPQAQPPEPWLPAGTVNWGRVLKHVWLLTAWPTRYRSPYERREHEDRFRERLCLLRQYHQTAYDPGIWKHTTALASFLEGGLRQAAWLPHAYTSIAAWVNANPANDLRLELKMESVFGGEAVGTYDRTSRLLKTLSTELHENNALRPITKR